MNATLLTPLIKEYIKGSQISEQDLIFLLQTGRDLEMEETAVRSLVNLEIEKQNPGDGEPAAPFYAVVKAMAKKGPLAATITPDVEAWLIETGITLNVKAEATQALVNLATGKATISPLHCLGDLVRGLIRKEAFNPATVEFIRQRASELKLSAQLAEVMQRLESSIVFPGSDQPLAVYDALHICVIEGGIATATDYLQQKAAELQLPLPVVLAFTTFVANGKATTVENYAKVCRICMMHKDIPSLLGWQKVLAARAESLKLPTQIASSVLLLETAIYSSAMPEAEAILKKQIAQQKDNGELTGAASAYFTAKLAEIKNTDIQPKAKTKSTDLETTLPPHIVEETVKKADNNIQKKESSDNKAPTAKEVRPNTAPEPKSALIGKAMMEELYLYDIPDSTPVVKKAKLISHAEGLHWYLQLSAPASQGTQGLFVANGQAHDLEQVSELAVSRDGAQFAYVLKESGLQRVSLNGRKSDGHDAIGELTFSPDGQLFAYVARDGRAYSLISNGVQVKTSAGIQHLLFNPATNKPAYALVEDKKWHVLYNGVLDPSYGSFGNLMFSPDGSKFVYWARKGAQAFVVLNSTQGPPFDGVGDFAFSQDSKQFAYFVNLPGGKCGVFSNGKTGPAFDRIRKIQFSPDNRALYYLANKDGREYLVINHQASSAFDEVDGLCFSANGRIPAFIVTQAKEKMVVREGTLGKSYNEVSQLRFLAEGDVVLYKAYRDKQWVVVNGETEEEGFTDIDDIAISAHGNRYAYIAKQRSQWTGIVLDGQRRKEAYNPKHLVLSDTGEKYVYMTYKKEGWTAHLNDGVVNAKPYTDLLQPPRYDSEKQLFYFLARADKSLVAVFIG